MTTPDALQTIALSGFFSRDWYQARYAHIDFAGRSPEEHFLYFGAELKTDPGPLFDTGYYLEMNPDVAESQVNPLVHYLLFGQSEGRKIRRVDAATEAADLDSTDPDFDALTPDEQDAAIKAATQRLVSESALFDADWYRRKYGAEIGDMAPHKHYVSQGAGQGKDPGPYFRTHAYYVAKPQVRKKGLNALAHYLSVGHKSHDRPCSEFSSAWYSQSVGDEMPDWQLPIDHYLSRDDRWTVETSPALDPDWISASAPYRAGVFDDIIHFLRDLETEDPALAARIQSYGLTRPRDFKTFLADALIFDPRALPTEFVEEARRAIPDGTLVSVVMPTWNRAATICRAMDSVLMQSWTNLELIVVDDGSTDDTVRILKTLYHDDLQSGRLRLIEQENGGVCRARNAGLETAKGDVIAYLDSDNAWRQDMLVLLLGGLFSTPGAQAAYAAFHVRDTVHDIDRISGARYDRTELLKSNFIDLNAFVHRPEASGTGPIRFNETLNRLVDWELILRLTRWSEPVYVPVVGVDYYIDAKLENITLTESLTANASAVMSLHRHEFYRHGLVSAERYALEYVKGAPEDARGRALDAEARENGALTASLSLAVVVDDDVADEFADLAAHPDWWFVKAIYRRGPQGFEPLTSAGAPPRAISTLPESAVYWPTTRGNMLTAQSVLTAALSIGFNGLDVALVSHHGHGQGAAGQVAIRSIRDQVLVSRPAADGWLRKMTLPACVSGRVLRLETDRIGKTPPLTSLDTALEGVFDTDAGGQAFWTKGTRAQILPAIAFDPASLPVRPVPEDRDSVVVLGMKTSVGGVERLSLNLAKALSDRFNAIYLALEPTRADQGDLSTAVTESGALLINGSEIVSPSKRGDLLVALNRAYRPKAVFIMNGSTWLAAHADVVRNAFPDARILDQQVYDHREGWINHYHKPSIRRFDKFVAINRKIQKAFEQDHGIDPGRIAYIPHGYDTEPSIAALETVSRKEAAAQYGLDPGKRNILFAGRMAEQKRPLDFLKLAEARAEHANEAFVMIGDGALADACREQIATQKLGNVRMIPFLSGLSRIYRAADALVIPSAYEGLPLVLVEAICMGLPVAATDVGEVRDVVERFQAGVASARPGDIAAMSAQLDQVLADAERFRTMAADARKEFSLDVMVDRYVRTAGLSGGKEHG